MPVPTEQLDADIRELDRRIGTRLDSVDRSLAAIREDFSGFRGATDANLKLIRWLGAFFAAIPVSLLAGLVTLTWHASAVNSEVKRLGEDFRGSRVEAKESGGRLEKIERQLEVLIKSARP
jgi:hypothetical protein